LFGEELGVLGAQDSAELQIASVADDLDGHVRAVGPVTQIFGEDLLAVVDGEAQGDERHRSRPIIAHSISRRDISRLPSMLERTLS